MTRQYQAWHFARQILMDRLCGVRFSVWYEWGGNEFGFFESDGSERPVANMMRKVCGELAEFRIEKRIETESDMDYIIIVGSDKGERKLVAWTSPPYGGAPDEFSPHSVSVRIDDREPFSLDLGGAPVFVKID